MVLISIEFVLDSVVCQCLLNIHGLTYNAFIEIKLYKTLMIALLMVG